MRFISYDPEPYVNEDATLYTKVWVEPKPAYHSSSAYSGDDMEQVEKCCHIIEDRSIDITATSLASLGERGRSLFHLVSSQNAKYKASETDKKFDNLLRNVSSINIGTFFHICSLHGINWKEGSL